MPRILPRKHRRKPWLTAKAHAIRARAKALAALRKGRRYTPPRTP